MCSGLVWVRTLGGRSRLSASIVSLGVPLGTLEAASKAATSGKLTASERSASVTSAVLP